VALVTAAAKAAAKVEGICYKRSLREISGGKLLKKPKIHTIQKINTIIFW